MYILYYIYGTCRQVLVTVGNKRMSYEMETRTYAWDDDKVKKHAHMYEERVHKWIRLYVLL